MHGVQDTCVNACILSTENAHAPMQTYATVQTRRLFAMKTSYLESCAGIVQAVVCRLPWWCLDEITCLTLFAQEICQNPRYLTGMTRSPLRYCTSLSQSSALVQVSSSLSMVCFRVWPDLILLRIIFPTFFSRAFLSMISPWDSCFFSIMSDVVSGGRKSYASRVDIIPPGGLLRTQRNLSSKAYVPDLSSVVPAPRFTTTLGHFDWCCFYYF